MPEKILFAGNSNMPLSKQIAKHLNKKLGKVIVSKFNDGEIQVKYLESIRGKDVFLLQSISAPQNTHLMELLLLADAARRGFANSITAIVPYMAYARQDRQTGCFGEPITAKLIADLLKTSGIDRFVTVNLHADQIQGFFDIPTDNLDAASILKADALEQLLDHVTVVAPDSGGIANARIFAQQLNEADLAFINKHRSKPNVSEVLEVIGQVEGRHCILLDDLVDTAGTLVSAAKVLKAQGALGVTAYCVHPVLSGVAVDVIEDSALDHLTVTDSILLSEDAKQCSKIRQLSIASILSEAVLRAS